MQYNTAVRIHKVFKKKKLPASSTQSNNCCMITAKSNKMQCTNDIHMINTYQTVVKMRNLPLEESSDWAASADMWTVRHVNRAVVFTSPRRTGTASSWGISNSCFVMFLHSITNQMSTSSLMPITNHFPNPKNSSSHNISSEKEAVYLLDQLKVKIPTVTMTKSVVNPSN